jgi:hypothetical protein
MVIGPHRVSPSAVFRPHFTQFIAADFGSADLFEAQIYRTVHSIPIFSCVYVSPPYFKLNYLGDTAGSVPDRRN